MKKKHHSQQDISNMPPADNISKGQDVIETQHPDPHNQDDGDHE